MLDTGFSAAALLRGYSLEVLTWRASIAQTCGDMLPAGSEVYVGFPPSATHERLASVAGAVVQAGFIAVPHVAARSLPSFTRFNDLLRRLHDNGVDRALVIGGDRALPAGPYASAEDLLRTGAFERHGFSAIGLACHPEPHRRIDRTTLDTALQAKLRLVSRGGMRPWLVSQFCLEAEPIVAMAERLRASGIEAPLRLGIAGPTNRRALWKYALACGLGASIRALGTHADAVRDLLQPETPDTLLTSLADRIADRPELGIAGLHIFGFGGVTTTTHWARRTCEEMA